MKVHLKVLEAKDLPVVDVSGTCDAYCKIQFGKQKVQTRIIDNSLTPRWRQQFSFDLIDFQDDFLYIQLYDHDSVGKDDLISDLEIKPQSMEPGLVIDKWYTMHQIIKKSIPQIHLVIHLSKDKDEPFTENPFQILVTNIRVIQAKDITLGEYNVSVGYKDNLMKESRKTNDLLWQEEFCLAMPLDEPNLKININKGKNIIANTSIYINFEVEKIIKDWFPLKPNGSIKLAIQVAPNYVKPFMNEKFEDFLPATELTAYFRIIEGKDLTAMDLNGKNDAYCTLCNLRDPKRIKTTQILYRSINPKWNYFMSVKVYDYQTDILRISCYDHDKLNKDDLIGYKDLHISNMGEGKVVDEWIDIYNSETGSKGSLHIMYQICTMGWIPFKTISLCPLKRIHIHVMDGHDIPNIDLIGKTDPYLRLKLGDQEFVQKTSVKDNTLNPLWDENITLFSLCQINSLQIELRDEATGKDPLLSTKNIDLSNIVEDDVVEYMEELIPVKGIKKGGIIHFYLQITNNEPFLKTEFIPYIDTGKKTKKGVGCLDSLDTNPTLKPLTLFVKIIQAFNLKAIDSNGLSDPYCVLKVNNQKKTTSVVGECLNPLWNEYFIFDINSLYYDFLIIDCMDKDKLSKDDLIGSIKIQISTLIMGKINELKLNLRDKDNNITGSLKFSLHVAKMGDIPFKENIWNQKVLNIRILEGKNLPNGYLYWTGKLDKEKENQFISKQTKEGKWIEEYQIKYSFEEIVILKLFEHSKKEIEIGEICFPYQSFKHGSIQDQIFNIGKKGQIHLILEMNDFGYPSFSTLPPLNMNDKLFLCKSLMLNIQVIEARDVPAMDRNGKSDPFIKLYLLGSKPKEKINEVKTKVIKKTLNPVWNEEYHFPIKSIGTDVLHMSFKDWNGIGSDDPISTYDLEMNSLMLGNVYDEWINFYPVKGVSKGGEVHLKYNLAPPGSYAFVVNIKDTLVFHIHIIEAKDVKSMDLNGFSDPYCKMQIIGDRTFTNSSIKYETLSPYWDEKFKFILTNYETDIFKLDLMDKDKISDDLIGSVNLQVNQYKIDKVYRQWIEVQNKGKKTGLIKVQITVKKKSCEQPFIGEIIEEKKNFIASDKWGINIHLIGASNLPAADANGLSDPYCLFTILNTKTSIKSRRIDKCINPKWDEYFTIPVNSLNSDILRLEILDWDKRGKDDKLCMLDFPLLNYELGKIYSDKYTCTPLEGKKAGTTVELMFQITPPNVIPFTETIYIPDKLNIRLEDVSDIVFKKPLKNPKMYFNIKLEKDSNEGLKSMTNEELNNELKEDFNFIITDPLTDRLILEYKNESDKNKTISKCILPLNDLKIGVTEEIKNKMDPLGTIHLYLQLNKKNEEPFQDIKLLSACNPYMTLYIKVISGSEIPVADESGLSDPFCVLGLQDRKNEKKTSVKKQTLNPVWNQEFQFKILSYNTDIFYLSLYDYDKYSKNDLLGKWTKCINNIKPGIVYEENIKAGGNISIKYHLACPNQPKWENCETLPMILNIKVIEAKEFPNNTGKTDAYVELFFKDDLKKIRTRTLDNTMTPQWFQEFQIYVIDINEPFFIKLWDENTITKNTPLSETCINLNNYKLNYVYNDWYDMKPLGSYKIGGKVRLEIQLTEYNNLQPPFIGPRNPSPPLPISQTSMLFNIKIIKVNNIQAMDKNNSSDPYCKLEFVGIPESVRKTRVIENSLKPFWDEFFQFEIKSLHDIFKISLWDHDKITKDDLISYYTIDLSECLYGINHEEKINMIPFNDSIYEPGEISIFYQITKPRQQIFNNEGFDVDTLNCYLEKIEGIIPGTEYYCEIKTVDSFTSQTSKVFTDGILMETFDILMRKEQPEILEIILYQHEIKGQYKFPKEIKRIQYPIKELGQLYIEGFKFTLAINQPKEMFTPPPQIIFPIRYFHIYVDKCKNLPSMDTNGSCDPFVKISLNKNTNERYLNQTRVISKNFNPIFKHTFHIPIYSLRDDIIIVEVYDYDKVTRCDLIEKLEFKISSIEYGIVKDDWYNIGKGKIHLITHLSDQNKPAFISEAFTPLYLNVKVFEFQDSYSNKRNVAVHMKNDLYPKLDSKECIHSSKIKQFSNAIFTIPITNINEKYIIEKIDPDSNTIKESYEFDTEDLKEGYIYRNYNIGLRFWTQILSDKNTIPFSNDNFMDYYNLPPEKNHMLYIEVKKMTNLKSSDLDGLSDPYFIAYYGDQQYRSRIIDNNLNPTFYDEFKFIVKNLEAKLMISILDKDYSRDDLLDSITIDLTSEPFGHVVDKVYHMSYGSIYMKWQVTQPGQSRWEEKKFKPNILNINIGKYEKEYRNGYEFWKIKFDYITKQTLITPFGVFNETYSFILADQTQIIFEQYKINKDNTSLLVNTIPFYFIDKSNGPINITDELSGLMEIVPYGTTPFKGQKFPLYFSPPLTTSVSVFLRHANNLSDGKYNSYILFKFKDRQDLNQMSLVLPSNIYPMWNQYFNFEVKSIATDILEVYVNGNKNAFPDEKKDKIEIPICQLLDGNIQKQKYTTKGNSSVTMDIQLIYPNIEPFSEYKIEYDNIFIKFLDGNNLIVGDIYCKCKLTDDISWKKTRTIKMCRNPQWYQEISLPITNEKNQVQVEVYHEVSLGDKCIGSFNIDIDQISMKTIKQINKIGNGTLSYLIQKGANGLTPFEDYEEPFEKLLAENVILAIKLVEAKNLKVGDTNTSDPYCVLELNGTEQKSRVIDSTLNPIWNQYFYFNISSFQTNELLIKIFDKDELSKDDLLYKLIIPIKNLKYGIVEDKWYSSLHLITHILIPGNYTFISNPFIPIKKFILIENLDNMNLGNIFCKLKLRGDEYWKYTTFGNFKDYFEVEYVNNYNLIMIAISGKNQSEVINFDISKDEEKIFENNFGKFKISFPKEMKPIIPIYPSWTCNILIKNISGIEKQKDILWMVEINKSSSGYTYDGSINKYITLNINSAQNEKFKVILYKEEKGQKSEYAKGEFSISEFELGITKEKIIDLEKIKLLGDAYTDKKIITNIHITPPNTEPFINQRFYPLIMHIYALEAINIPKMDLMSKTDPYVVFRFEKDLIGRRTKHLEDTLTPQWNELVDLIITDENEDLIIEIWDKNIKMDKMICSTKLNIKKYLNGEPEFMWLTIGKVKLNIVCHIKQEGEDFIGGKEIEEYQANNILP